jgi:hypothetical protein
VSERRVLDVTTVQFNIHSEATNSVERVFSSVSSISVITLGNFDFSFIGGALNGTVADGDIKVITSNGLGNTVFIDSVDCEGKSAERSGISIGTGDNVGSSWRVSDVLSFSIIGSQDRDLVVAGGIGTVLNIISTITVVLEVRRNRGRTLDIDVGMTINNWLVVLVVKVDLEFGGFIVKSFGETITFNKGVTGRGLRNNGKVERRVFNVSTIAGNGDGVRTRVGWGPGSVVGTVAIIMDGFRVDGASWSDNFNLEVEATISDGFTSFIASSDNKRSTLVDFTAFNTRAFSGRVAGYDARFD